MSSNDELEARINSDRQLARDAIAVVVFEAIRERDHLRVQVGELQTYNTAVLERARKAESERDALAVRCSDLEARIPLLQSAETIPPPPDGDFDPRGVSLQDACAQLERGRESWFRDNWPVGDPLRMVPRMDPPTEVETLTVDELVKMAETEAYDPYDAMNAACAATEAGEVDLESHIVSNLINAEGPVDDDEPTLGDEVLP